MRSNRRLTDAEREERPNATANVSTGPLSSCSVPRAGGGGFACGPATAYRGIRSTTIC